MKKIYSLFIAFVTIALIGRSQVVNPGICMVTVDDSSKHNIVYYDKHQFGPGVADSFILWREMISMPGMYERVMANDTNAFSMFLDRDPMADPNLQLNRYKLQIWHHIAGYSQLGPYHTVLYCLQNVQNYNWNQYDIEGTGTGVVNSYVVLQDDNSTNTWHPIDTVSGSTNSWVDPNVASWPNGQWRLATLWPVTCTPNARYGNNGTQNTIIKSKSNITNNKSAGIQQFKSSSFGLYPNPATEQVTLRTNFPVSENTTVKIYNALGVEVLSTVLSFGKDELVVPVSGMQKGIYFAEISNKQSKVTKRLAVE